MQMIGTVTTKGQVAIPAAIRQKLNIYPSDRVIFNVSGEKIIVEKTASISGMMGFVKSNKKFSDKELEAAINQATLAGLSEI